MNWLKNLTGIDITKQMQNLRNDKAFKTALLSPIALTASADGEIEDDEIDHASMVIQKNDKLAGFDHAELRREFMSLARQAANKADRYDLLNNIARIATKPDQARLVVGLAEETAMADGDLEAPEIKELRKICREADVDPNDYDFVKAAAV